MDSEILKNVGKLVSVDAKDMDNKRENANINADGTMGTMLKIGSDTAKKYLLDFGMLPYAISNAHKEGDIHIHDADFYFLTMNCCQIDLSKLFKTGFSTGHGHIRPPKGIRSYAALAAVVIQANQNDMFGGQSIPAFDWNMAPGVRDTFNEELKNVIQTALATASTETEKELTPVWEAIEYTRWGLDQEREFTDKACIKESQLSPEINILDPRVAYQAGIVWQEAVSRTQKEVHQAMEALIHNLNTLNSRAGAQVPFSALNYGTDTSAEGRMVTRQLLIATLEGIGYGETPIFPVQIFKLKAGVNYNEDDPNYDLFKLACKCSAKRLFPNFSNLDAPFNLQYYKPGDYNSEVALMGCRTRVMGNKFGPEVTCGRGNLSFTTINLPRLGILANQKHGKYVEELKFAFFLDDLDDVIDYCILQLQIRFQVQAKRKAKNFPFLMQQGVWLDSEKLGPEDSIEPVLKHGTLTIGFIGLAECLVALFGKHHGESEKSQEYGLKIVEHMRKRMDMMRGYANWSLIATPAEGLSGRFTRLDKKRFGIIPGVTDRDYYTNSFHVPVYYPITAAKKIDIEAPYHELCNAGHISYVEFDGDPSKNLEAFERIVRYMHDKNIGYGSINHAVDRDPVCGYTGIINDICPRCGRKAGEPISKEKLDEIRKRYGTFGQPVKASHCSCAE